MEDATPDQLRFMNNELARFLASGAWEESHCARWASRLILVPKPGVSKWRLIIDLRPLNRYCEERDLSFETLTRLRHLVRPGDYMLSMDLEDGFYAVGIAPEDRDYFTIDYRGKLYRLAGLPMGWRLSPYHVCSLTATFNHHLRRPDIAVTSQGVHRTKISMGRRHALAGTSVHELLHVLCVKPGASPYDVRDRLTSVRSKGYVSTDTPDKAGQ
eukprot:jgi/Tetstr1/429504/TSEL_019409.t1